MNCSDSHSSIKAHFITLGCPKNEADTRKMASLLREANIYVVEDLRFSDVVIINTCAFIQSAIEESIEAILDVIEDEYITSNSIPIIVSGCLPARYEDDLTKELPEVARFVGCDDEGSIVDRILEVASPEPSTSSQSQNNAIMDEQDVSERFYEYVKISDGCSRNCSYCTIPSIRGSYRSYPLNDIIAEVDSLVSSGKKEIVLIAQDTGIWGLDLSDGSNLASLLTTLAERYHETWFRVMYLQPSGINEDLLDTIAAHDNICSYFDIPLQHVDPEILRSMNRTGSAGEFEEMVKKIRSRIPNAALRTTLIAGYPGETEEQFEELLEFVSLGLFDYVGVFPYSREEGTKAADLPDQIDEEEKNYRASRLRDHADAVSTSIINSRHSSRYPVLIEGVEEDGQLVGRLSIQAPEVDGVFFIDKGCVGEIGLAEIEDSFLYDMEGVLL